MLFAGQLHPCFHWQVAGIPEALNEDASVSEVGLETAHMHYLTGQLMEQHVRAPFQLATAVLTKAI